MTEPHETRFFAVEGPSDVLDRFEEQVTTLHEWGWLRWLTVERFAPGRVVVTLAGPGQRITAFRDDVIGRVDKLTKALPTRT